MTRRRLSVLSTRPNRQFVERALAAVAAAIQDDFDDSVLITTDPDLVVLHGEPAFQSLLEKDKRR